MEEHSFFEQLPPSKRHEVEVRFNIAFVISQQSQLDILNQTAPQINQLENNLLAARATYQNTLTEHSSRLNAIGKRLGKCVQRARPYYDAKAKQAELTREIQRATERYNRANDLLTASCQALSKLENATPTGTRQVGDVVSLEALNQCIFKVNEAKREALEAKEQHERLLATYNDTEKSIHNMERRLKMDIKKAQLYFSTKQRFDERMQEAKLRVESCADRVNLCKSLYAEAMLKLEQISESLHDTRRRKTLDLDTNSRFLHDDGSPSPLVRGQGVGADSLECINEPDCRAVHSPVCIHAGSAAPSRISSEFSSAPDLSSPNLVSLHSETVPVEIVTGLIQNVHEAESELGAFRLAVTSSNPTSEMSVASSSTGATSLSSSVSFSSQSDVNELPQRLSAPRFHTTYNHNVDNVAPQFVDLEMDALSPNFSESKINARSLSYVQCAPLKSNYSEKSLSCDLSGLTLSN
ncbi:hypothetical protein T265_11553 [Opisthorchis viverrini]|uniref:SH3 domain-binding protein 5 n=1 Tax=Opisthorchis viverrini TaxID=6198 RepID=A0A074ZX57_OPIVI|nr:hypothetical protein T265_11553 [Opisthorchis viverrini]KER19759.1 hypothetical protein T265_11553 [Opisthorchis viverrini]